MGKRNLSFLVILIILRRKIFIRAYSLCIVMMNIFKLVFNNRKNGIFKYYYKKISDKTIENVEFTDFRTCLDFVDKLLSTS